MTNWDMLFFYISLYMSDVQRMCGVKHLQCVVIVQVLFFENRIIYLPVEQTNVTRAPTFGNSIMHLYLKHVLH